MAGESKQCIVTVVDDNPRIQESIKDLLASAGFDARTFSSAEEILKTNELELACCMITDVRMPGIDGWELQRIAIRRAPNLPIIFITAHQDDVARQRAEGFGAFAILYKPFDGEELLEAVSAAISSPN